MNSAILRATKVPSLIVASRVFRVQGLESIGFRARVRGFLFRG